MHHILKEYGADKDKPVKLHENRVFTVFFNGCYHYIEFNCAPCGAIAIPRFSNGDFLRVKQRRSPIFGESIEFPRGGVDRGEAPAAGARRELREETGYKVEADALMFLGKVGADTATLNHEGHVFLVDIPEGAKPGEFDTNEISELIRVTPAQLKQMVRENKIFDGQTLAAFAMLAARL
jgi:8-oxo-dGTP pyrophosphatase MutT (NUDIX family)